MEGTGRVHILVLSHGYMGQEMIKGAEMIMGQIEDITFIPLTNEISVEDYREKVKKTIQSMPEGSIVLADLYGGTPCNTAALISREHEVNLVAGFNLPLLIECVQLRDEYTGMELCEEAVKNVKDSMLTVQIGKRGI